MIISQRNVHINLTLIFFLSTYFNRILNTDNTTFVINVCKPVLYGHEDMCPPGSSICLQNNNESNLSKKLVRHKSLSLPNFHSKIKFIIPHEIPLTLPYHKKHRAEKVPYYFKHFKPLW